MSALGKIGLAAAALHIAFLIYVMYRMSMGGMLTDPLSWAFAAWAIAPTVFVAWRGLTSDFWVFALIPLILFGTYGAYDMGFVSTSSTTALGLIFLPLYEWAYISVAALVKLVLKA